MDLKAHLDPVAGSGSSVNPAEESHRLELAARSCLEARYGRALSEAEWASAKRALLDFGRLLCDWSQGAVHADRAA